MIAGRSAKNVDLLVQNVVVVQTQCWNYSQESICFSEGKFFGTRSNETGAEEYTIPASNAFGLPHRFPAWQSAAACQGESLKPLEKFTIWRNRRHEENDFICCRNICRKCGRCNCNVHFTGEQKISEGERKWQVLI